MENIINKATEGGYSVFGGLPLMDTEEYMVICDPLFWQALGKAKGWNYYSEHFHPNGEECNGFCVEDVEQTGWKVKALQFHEINLTQGFESAVEWLEELVTS